jgi:dihydrofolate reductase
VIGSGNLVQSLMKVGLVDEYRLSIHPIMLGSGKRLFGDGVVPVNLKLMNSTTTPSGITFLSYRPQK